MRTAIAYLTSLLCHGAVLIPLASISGWSATPPRYSMQHGGPASVSLRASLAAPGDAAELDNTQATVSALPPAGQAGQESPPLPEVTLTVLPETKVLARVNFRAAARSNSAVVSRSDGAAVALPHPRGRGGSTTATPTSRSATRPQPTGHVASHGRGSTGTDAFSSAGSAGNSGGGRADQAPSAVASNPVPPYPADALARGVEGLVLLRVRIGADGSVQEATIDRSSGTPSLDESALSTVRHRWHFEPATRCGAAVSYEALLPIRFTIRAG
ncbi:MAG: energy transducer TonB [Thermoguttaceae bacterium]